MHFWMFHAIVSAQFFSPPKFFLNELWVRQPRHNATKHSSFCFKMAPVGVKSTDQWLFFCLLFNPFLHPLQWCKNELRVASQAIPWWRASKPHAEQDVLWSSECVCVCVCNFKFVMEMELNWKRQMSPPLTGLWQRWPPHDDFVYPFGSARGLKMKPLLLEAASRKNVWWPLRLETTSKHQRLTSQRWLKNWFSRKIFCEENVHKVWTAGSTDKCCERCVSWFWGIECVIILLQIILLGQ